MSSAYQAGKYGPCLAELINHRFLRTVRKRLHAPNDYIFLWHAIFSGTDRRGSSSDAGKEHSRQDRKDTSAQKLARKLPFPYQESQIKRIR